MPVNKSRFLKSLGGTLGFGIKRLTISDIDNPQLRALAAAADRIPQQYSYHFNGDDVNNGEIDRYEEWEYIYDRLEVAENDDDTILNRSASMDVLRAIRSELRVKLGQRWDPRWDLSPATTPPQVTRIGADAAEDIRERRVRAAESAMRRLFETGGATGRPNVHPRNRDLTLAYMQFMSVLASMNTGEREAFLESLSDDDLGRLITISSRPPPWAGRRSTEISPTVNGETAFDVLMAGIEDGRLAARVLLQWRSRAKSKEALIMVTRLANRYLNGAASDEQRKRFIETLALSFHTPREIPKYHGVMRFADPAGVAILSGLLSFDDSGRGTFNETIEWLHRIGLLDDVVEASVDFGQFEIEVQMDDQPASFFSGLSDPYLAMQLLQKVQRQGTARVQGYIHQAFIEAAEDSESFPFDLISRITDQRSIGKYANRANTIQTAHEDLATLISVIDRDASSRYPRSAAQEALTAGARLFYTLQRLDEAGLREFYSTYIDDASSAQGISNAQARQVLSQVLGGAPGGAQIMSTMMGALSSGQTAERLIELATFVEEGYFTADALAEVAKARLESGVMSHDERLNMIERMVGDADESMISLADTFDAHALLVAVTLTSLKDDPLKFQAAMKSLFDRKLPLDWTYIYSDQELQQRLLPNVQPTLLYIIARSAVVPLRESEHGRHVLGPKGVGARFGHRRNRPTNNVQPLIELIEATAVAGNQRDRAQILAAATQGGLRKGVLKPRGERAWYSGVRQEVRDVALALKDMLETETTYIDENNEEQEIDFESTIDGLMNWDPRATGLTWLFVFTMGAQEWLELDRSTFTGATLDEALRQASLAYGVPPEELDYRTFEDEAGDTVVVVNDGGIDDPFTAPPGQPDGFQGQFYAMWARLAGGHTTRDRVDHWYRPNKVYRERLGYFEGARQGAIHILETSIRSDVRFRENGIVTSMNIERELWSLVSIVGDLGAELRIPRAGRDPMRPFNTLGSKWAVRASELGVKIYLHQKLGVMREKLLREEEEQTSALHRYLLYIQSTWTLPIRQGNIPDQSGVPADLRVDPDDLYQQFDRERRHGTAAGRLYRPNGEDRDYLPDFIDSM